MVIFIAVGGVLLVIAILVTAGVMAIRKMTDSHTLAQGRMITQPVLAVMGMMFSVLLGFFIANAMRNYHETNTLVQREGTHVGDVFRLARGLDEIDRKRIRQLCRAYTDVVISDEWKAMKEGKDSERAWEIYQEMWEAIESIPATDNRSSNIQMSLLTSMRDLGENRRGRIARSASHLPPDLWVVIACGASALLLTTFLFSPDNRRYHILIAVSLMIPISLNIYLLAEYMYPFAGPHGVKPIIFEVLQKRVLSAPDTPPRFMVHGGETIGTQKDATPRGRGATLR